MEKDSQKITVILYKEAVKHVATSQNVTLRKKKKKKKTSCTYLVNIVHTLRRCKRFCMNGRWLLLFYLRSMNSQDVMI